VAPPPKFESLHAAHLERWDGSILDPQLDEFVRDLCRRLGSSTVALPPDTRAELAQLPKLKPLAEVGVGNVVRKSRLPTYAAAGAVLASALALGGWWIFERVADPGPQTQTVEAEVPSEAPHAAPPNDPLLPRQWYLAGSDEGGTGVLDYVRRTGATGEGVVIAAIDAGIYRPHPDLATANILPGADLVSDVTIGNDGDGRDDDPTDPGDSCDPSQKDPDSQHGTFNASLVTARANDGVGIAGVAPGAKLLPVRALGRCGGKLSDINLAIRWAAGVMPFETANGAANWNASRADIIVLPIGLSAPCPESLQLAIDDAVKAGAIIVAAAGNKRVDTKFFAPGGCENVISVAASDRRGHLSEYSNFGPGVSVLAPGGDMARDDDADGRPDGIVGARYSQNCQTNPGSAMPACEYSFENGSNMASMLVGGGLALMKSRHPDESNAVLTARFLAATRPRNTLQCSGACGDYPGAEKVPGLNDICFRRCGAGLLDLSKAD
jgi:serine protease